MSKATRVPYEDQVAQASWDAIDSDARGMAAMMGDLPDSERRTQEQDLTDWMFRNQTANLPELQQGVAANTITPQMAQAIQFHVDQGWLDPDETAKLTPKDAGMLVLYPRRLMLLRTGRPDPEMQIRFSDRMEALKRRQLEEQAESMPMGMMPSEEANDGSSLEA